MKVTLLGRMRARAQGPMIGDGSHGVAKSKHRSCDATGRERFLFSVFLFRPFPFFNIGQAQAFRTCVWG